MRESHASDNDKGKAEADAFETNKSGRRTPSTVVDEQSNVLRPYV